MKYSKGQTGNPHGRPVGSKNKVTADLREWVKELLDGTREQFIRDMQALEPYQRLVVWERLLAYVLPKPATEIEDKERIDGIEMRIVYPDGTVKVEN
jgi:hypothetical protein